MSINVTHIDDIGKILSDVHSLYNKNNIQDIQICIKHKSGDFSFRYSKFANYAERIGTAGMLQEVIFRECLRLK